MQLNGALSVTSISANLQIVDDFALNGILTLASPFVSFSTASINQQITSSSTGSFLFTLNDDFAMRQTGSSHTVTFGAGILIDGTGGQIGYTSGGVAGAWVFASGSTVSADVSGDTIILVAGNTFTNQAGATWQGVSNGILNIAGAFTNNGVIQANGGTVGIQTANWSNVGTISVNAGTLNLGGSFTQFALGAATPQSGQGTFTRSGGTVNLTGTLSGNLTLDANTGPWVINGGNIVGVSSANKTIVTTSGANNLTTSTSATLDNVQLNGALSVTSDNANLQIVDDFTLNGTLTLASPFVSFSTASTGQQITSSSTGEFLFTLNDNFAMRQTGSAHTVTFGAGILIDGTGGQIGYTSGGVTGTWIFASGSTVSADVSGDTITLVAGNTFTNQTGATWQAVNNGILSVAGAWTNSGTIIANGGVVTTTNAPTNFSGGTLTGGAWEAIGGGTLKLTTPAVITTNAATILIDGASSNIDTGNAGSTFLQNSLTTNAAGRNLTLKDGSSPSRTPARSRTKATLPWGRITPRAT